MNTYKAKVVRVLNGDTISAEVSLGFNIKITETIRLLRIDTPENRGKEKAKGKVVTKFLTRMIEGKEVELKINPDDKKGKFGRYLAEVYYKGENVNDKLVKLGMAVYRDY